MEGEESIFTLCRKEMIKWIKMVCQGWFRRIFNIRSEESKRRLKICMACEDKVKLIKGEFICGHCGCPIKTATLADDKKCDLNKW